MPVNKKTVTACLQNTIFGAKASKSDGILTFLPGRAMLKSKRSKPVRSDKAGCDIGMKRMLFAVLALLTALVLCACGGTSGTAQTESSPYAGTWTATSASYGETDVPIEEVFAEGMSLELQSNGVCQLTLGEQSDPATWSAVDGAITISDGETDFLGTIDETAMVLDISGMTITLTREEN